MRFILIYTINVNNCIIDNNNILNVPSAVRMCIG